MKIWRYVLNALHSARVESPFPIASPLSHPVCGAYHSGTSHHALLFESRTGDAMLSHTVPMEHSQLG